MSATSFTVTFPDELLEDAKEAAEMIGNDLNTFILQATLNPSGLGHDSSMFYYSSMFYIHFQDQTGFLFREPNNLPTNPSGLGHDSSMV